MSRDVMRWRANLKRIDTQICRKCGLPFSDAIHDPEGHVFEKEEEDNCLCEYGHGEDVCPLHCRQMRYTK